jgi:beta-mannosidase
MRERSAAGRKNTPAGTAPNSRSLQASVRICASGWFFEGIDLYGQVFVNGKLAGATKDAFAMIDFEVKALLQEGANELVVRVTSGMELASRPAIPPTNAENELFNKLDGGIYAVRSLESLHGTLRKPRCTFGTDFCDPLPNIGIWRSVRLEDRNRVVIHHLRLDTTIRDTDVSLEGEVTLENLHPWSEIPAVLELQLDPSWMIDHDVI